VTITKLLLSTEGVHVSRKIYIDISWCAESVVVVVAEKGALLSRLALALTGSGWIKLG
jgi:hypothetical protein